MAVRLEEVERAYFVRKLAVQANNNKPLNQIKREYYAKFLAAGTATTPLNQLELLWLRKVVSDAGQTPQKYENDLWKQMVISISQAPVAKTNQNKIIFYSTAP